MFYQKDSVSFRAYPAQNRFNKFLSIGSLFSIMRGSTCEILGRVDGDAVVSDSAYSVVTAADVVVPVCPSSGLGPLDHDAFVRWSSEIRQDLFW